MKFYYDTIHGLTALASSHLMAWQLIRNECHKRGLEIPQLDCIICNSDEHIAVDVFTGVYYAIGSIEYCIDKIKDIENDDIKIFTKKEWEEGKI